ncbi:MAG: formylglycine-generating enzyme family protein [Planctomycetota bacterium]
MQNATRTLLLLFVAGTVLGGDRVSAPDVSARHEAEKVIKEVFKEDYAFTVPEERQMLARKLAQKAEETQIDLAAKYMFWREAASLLAQSGDLDAAHSVLEKMTGFFAVDRNELKKAVFADAASATKDQDVLSVLTGAGALLGTPGDPEASLLVGKYKCFTRGEWVTGLALLARSSDATLAALARNDLNNPAATLAQMALGDAWWEWAEKSPAPQAQGALKQRARFWYEKALPLLTELNKTKVEKRTQSVNLPATLTLELGGGVKMEFVLVEKGAFTMGAPDGLLDEKPVHTVTLTQPFYIGKYPVTVGQFRLFIKKMGYQTQCEKAGNKGWTVIDGKWQEATDINWENPGFKQSDAHPVVLASWQDAQAFATWVSELTGRDVRLPSEAQWEFAARGPKSLKYPWGDKWAVGLSNHKDAALKNSGFADTPDAPCSKDDDGFAFTAPVGLYRNSSWCGAFDLAGNVSQWVQDRYAALYYGANPQGLAQIDPPGPGSGDERVVRGGSWSDVERDCRSARRMHVEPERWFANLGFRVVVVLPVQQP